ncbi:MAG: Gfo/Idh/MocA family oxidoreductase [Pirellulales bacterium]|nr:Gfo/Idh/MocA family oxidoreductase [Pirellulales bacterium]
MSASTIRYSRRGLLKTAAATLPTWFLESSLAPALAAEKSPNARPRIALVGCGGMGQHDARLASKFGDVVAVCDVDAAHLAAAAEAFKGAEKFTDFRKVCDSSGVDVVINATPDHWHTLINLRAVRSGKDVYAEKPLTFSIDEGKRLVAAVKETDRILQDGSQQRSDPTFRLACELVRNGRLGRVERVRTWLPSGLHGGPFATAPVPPELDWDFWQGQTRPVDYVPERCHVKFRYWYDYSGGTMTDWGAHHNDIALWGLGKDHTGPVSAEGRPLVEPIPGGFTAPSQYEVKFVYADGVEHFCRSTSANTWGGGVQGRPGPGEKYHGVQFEGPEGWLYVTRGDKLEASDPDLISAPLPSGAERLYASDDHMANFFESVASRKPPICPVQIGHRSVSCCHVGVIALRLGRKVHWDPDAEQFADDAEANKYVAREQRQEYSYEML